jgi:hypothetical protein
MSDRPTPETDSYANRDWWTLFRANEHARQLERERDEAIRLLIEASEYSTTTSQENTEKFLRKIGKWEEAK